MFEAFSELYVDRLRLVWNSQISLVLSSATRRRQSVLDRLEGLTEAERRPGKKSSVELASLAVEGDISKLWSSVVYAQSYPDREPLALGLQKILNLHGIPATTFSGLSHLKSAAAIEGVSSVDLYLEKDSRAGLVVTEQFPYQSQTAGPNAGLDCGAMALSFTRTSGPLKVLGIARVIFPASVGALDAENVWLELAEKFPGIRLGGGESVLGIASDNDKLPSVPFQCWLELTQKLESGELKNGDTVALLASDNSRLISALVVYIQGALPVEKVNA